MRDRYVDGIDPRHNGFPPGFSIAFHKESLASTVSAQRRAAFLLMLSAP
jgi:hypothetical protein